MPELIDRVALLDILCSGCTKYSGGICRNEYGRCAEYTIIKQMPTIEAEPVRHGRWIEGTSRGSYSIYCSYCGSHKETICPTDYCPNCGARMDGGADNG